MITFMTDTIGDTIAGVATKNRLSIGTIFSVIKRMGSQVYSSPRKLSPTYAAALGPRAMQQWKINGHPRGFLGRKHTAAAKALISLASVRLHATRPAAKELSRRSLTIPFTSHITIGINSTRQKRRFS